MSPPPTRRTRRTATVLGGGALLLTGCSRGGLAPKGPEAARILDVLWSLVVAGGVVSLLVLGLWAWASFRPRGDDGAADDARAEDTPDTARGRRLVVVGGIVMPAVVMAGFLAVQIVSTTAETQASEGLTIEVTGHRYWWEATYRGLDGVEDFETANQVHVPTRTDVRVVLRSDDVIHSFWIPELAGKVDMVPGRRAEFVLSADQPGTYAGYCAEYCGLQHAWMKFEVVAMRPEAFRAWAEGQAAPAREPTTDLQVRGREVFSSHSCVGCHDVRGLAEGAELGPDLTHLGSRSELGAGVRPLTEADLRAWIANAQAVKPGVQMPPQQLDDEALDALVAYLTSLE